MADKVSFLVLVGDFLVPIEIAKNELISSIFNLLKEQDHRAEDYLEGRMPADCQYFRLNPPLSKDDFCFSFSFGSSLTITNRGAVLEAHAKRVSSVSLSDTIGKTFPDRVRPGFVCLLVENTVERPVKKRRLEGEDSTTRRPQFDEAQARDVEMTRKAHRPSFAAPMPAFMMEQKSRPVLNGRPCVNFGLPVGLFHPIFDSFQAAMKDDRTHPDPETYTLVRELFKASAEIYETEDDRISEIDRHLTPLLGNIFMDVRTPDVKSDGVMVQPCGPSIAYLVIRQVKNEMGTGGADPYNEGSLSYRKYWAGKQHDILRRKSYCPSFILAIAGPWLCVLGGIYADSAIVQPLTDYLWLGGDVFNDGRLASVSRLFVALKSAISRLRKYYDSLFDIAGHIPDGFPFVRNYQTETFSYISPLAEDDPHKLIYKARHDQSGRLLVVKFVSKYHAQAHRLLAEHQLAPVLHYAGTEDANAQKHGGRYMIVMDFVEEARPWEYYLSEDQVGQVGRAIDLLHSHDLVFGDLRRPNILITAGTQNVMIIDFNWCSRADEGRYPPSLNQDPEIYWAEGVGPYCIMRKQHDLDMLKKL
ncbi:hypothetical protein M0805_004905 [Coniferiporia weirii]|nr:hypothetical protein M0805_004905 [Coniferiporia weirii]